MPKKGQKGGESREAKRRRKSAEASARAKAANAELKKASAMAQEADHAGCKLVTRKMVTLSAVCTSAGGAPPAPAAATAAEKEPGQDMNDVAQVPAADAAAPGAPVQQQSNDKTQPATDNVNDIVTTPRAHPAPGVAQAEAGADAPAATKGLTSATDKAPPAASGPSDHGSTAAIALHQAGSQNAFAATMAAFECESKESPETHKNLFIAQHKDCAKAEARKTATTCIKAAINEQGRAAAPKPDTGGPPALGVGTTHPGNRAQVLTAQAPAPAASSTTDTAPIKDNSFAAVMAAYEGESLRSVEVMDVPARGDAAAALGSTKPDVDGPRALGAMHLDDCTPEPPMQAPAHDDNSTIKTAVAGAAAPLDDITIGHLVPAGDTAAAAAAASDDNVIGHAVPAGSGLACDTAAAAATRHQSPGPSCIIKRVAGAARDAVTAASATLAQARSAYWGLGCAVGGPLHVAGAVKYLLPPKYKRVPAAAIDGVLLAGRAAHAAYYGPGEVVALLADGLRVARAAWARA